MVTLCTKCVKKISETVGFVPHAQYQGAIPRSGGTLHPKIPEKNIQDQRERPYPGHTPAVPTFPQSPPLLADWLTYVRLNVDYFR